MTGKLDPAEIEAAAQAETQKPPANDTGSAVVEGIGEFVGDVVSATLDGTIEAAGSVVASVGEAAVSIISGIFEGL